jgi:putative membrane protein
MSSFLTRVWPPLPIWRGLDLGVLVVVLYGVAVEIITMQLELRVPKWIGDFNVVNAVLLGVLLAFRNKEAYERWWEARKLWGQLINDSRNLLLKAKAFAALDAGQLQTLERLVSQFAWALKYHLHDRHQGVPRADAFPLGVNHLPAHYAGAIMTLLQDWRKSGRLGDMDLLLLDPHVRGLMDVCGACERIQNSPVPLSYRSLLRHGTILYLATAPWFLASEFGYWGVGLVALVAYFLLGTELIAESIEDPFGAGGDDLQLQRFCETIQTSVAEIAATPP